jgi:hypothetical protein
MEGLEMPASANNSTNHEKQRETHRRGETYTKSTKYSDDRMFSNNITSKLYVVVLP